MTTTPIQGGKMNNAFNPASAASLSPRSRELVERRAQLLGPAYRLFYETPVQVSRGSGTRPSDSDGNEYLDAYNNVVCVGHAHPRVVEAVHAKCKRCAHTRATFRKGSLTTPPTCWPPSMAGALPDTRCSPAPVRKPMTWPCESRSTTPATPESSSRRRPTTAIRT
jgi:Aminotransferase class-III